MTNEEPVSPDQLGKGNTIKHPVTGEWVQIATQPLHGERGNPPIKTCHVTLENGEQFDFGPDDVIIRSTNGKPAKE